MPDLFQKVFKDLTVEPSDYLVSTPSMCWDLVSCYVTPAVLTCVVLGPVVQCL